MFTRPTLLTDVFATGVVIVPLRDELMARRSSFARLDTIVPSSFCLMAPLLVDAFARGKQLQITPDELIRSYWNIVDELSIQGRDSGYLPDTDMESIEAFLRIALFRTYQIRSMYEASYGIIAPDAGVTLKSWNNGNIVIQIVTSKLGSNANINAKWHYAVPEWIYKSDLLDYLTDLKEISRGTAADAIVTNS